MSTSLDVTPEKMAIYRATARRRSAEEQPDLVERRGQAWELARQAARLLREQFGAKRVVAFGSLAHKAWFGPRSDVDLAAWEIPPEQFYRAVAAVTGMSPDFEVDLVDPADCRPALRRAIEREGIDL